MGSMFKEPPGDYAGRLIEAAGLKGTRIGGAKSARCTLIFSSTMKVLLHLMFRFDTVGAGEVLEKFGVELELEIELIGE